MIDIPNILSSPGVSTTPLVLSICYLNLSIVILYQYPGSKITVSSGNVHILDLFVAFKHLMNRVLNKSLASRSDKTSTECVGAMECVRFGDNLGVSVDFKSNMTWAFMQFFLDHLNETKLVSWII